MTDLRAGQDMKNWREAHWVCFWVVFHGQPRLSAFHEMISRCGLSRREAAGMLHALDKEPS